MSSSRRLTRKAAAGIQKCTGFEKKHDFDGGGKVEDGCGHPAPTGRTKLQPQSFGKS